MESPDLPIGYMFDYTDAFGKTKRLCVREMNPSRMCAECAFDECSCITRLIEGSIPKCMAEDRADKTDVVFVRVT